MKTTVFNRKSITKAISFILTLILVATFVPTVLYAKAIEAAQEISVGEVAHDTSALGTEDSAQSIYDVNGSIYEVVSEREENVKHFHLEDGTYIAAQYDYPIHYMDESGKMQDIDNQLSEISGGVFANKNARIKFAKKINGSETLFALHDGNTKLTLSLNNAIKGVVGTVTNYDDSEQDAILQKMMNLEKLSSSIVYKDILPGVDIEYIAHSSNVKENIIVKEKADTYTYSFELKLNGLTAELLSSGDIQILNENTKEIQYIIPAPIVYDSNEEYAPSDTARYSLESNGGKYSLTVTVSAEWMNSSERAFPVTVDPAIVASFNYAQDTYVSKIYPNASYGNSAVLAINATTRSYWQTTRLPSIPSSAYLTNASITLTTSSSSVGHVGVYEVLTNWNENLTWSMCTAASPKGKIGDKVLDYNLLDGGTTYSWNITDLVKNWYAGNNYGVSFDVVAGQSASVQAYSSEGALGSNSPALTVTYKDMKGVESYWSYSSHSAGVAGSGSINLATGQLTLAIPTLSTTDSLIPYTPTLVYNSSMSGDDYTYSYTETANMLPYTPYGFKLNICETVIKKSFVDNAGTTKNYYVYADSDGTEHGFFPSSADSSFYIDEDGMQKVLTELEDGSVAITDDSKIVRLFTKSTYNYSTLVEDAWYLSEVIDKNGNAIIFAFDPSLRPIEVSMQPYNSDVINFLNIYYYPTGKIKMICNSASKDAVVFRYSSDFSGNINTSYTYYLRQIDYAHGSGSVTLTDWENFAMSADNTNNITVNATAKYEYNAWGNLVSVCDELMGQEFIYTWENEKVVLLQQYASEMLGQEISYDYYTGYTEIFNTGNDEILNTEDDTVTRYVFDEAGRSTSIYSYAKNGTEIYSATVGQYETQANIKNNLKEQTTIPGTSVNYLLNGDFEKISSTGIEHWSTFGEAQVTSPSSFSGEGNHSITFNPTAGSSAGIYQYVSLPAGEYTLSFPYKTQISDGISGTVVIESMIGSGLCRYEQVPLNQNYSTGTESVFSMSFTVPNYANGVDKLELVIYFMSSSNVMSAPNIEIDRVMLENHLGNSKFSLVEYGSFYESVLNASGSRVPISEYWQTEENTSPSIADIDETFDYIAKINGDIGEQRYIKQRIYQITDDELYLYDYNRPEFRSNVGNEYLVSGFGLSIGAVSSPNARFGIRIDVIYYQGVGNEDVVVSYFYDFASYCKEWQFTGGSFNTEYEKASEDTNNYSCVKAIDIYCEYSYQPNWFALFDNISVVNSKGKYVEKYHYYSEGEANGLLWRKESMVYKEYYEYNENRNLSRVASNRGEITDYFYTAKNEVDYTIDYNFVWMDGLLYPYNYEDPDAEITKTPKTKTNYSYNAYGLTTMIRTYQLDDDYTELSESKDLFKQFSYNTLSGQKIFGSLKWENDALGNELYYYYDNTNGRLLATVNPDENTGLCYTYDEMDNLVGVTPARFVNTIEYSSVEDSAFVSYQYNDSNLLEKIITDSTEYELAYDVFGNPTSVKAGDSTISSYTYNDNNGKLNKITYSNGFVVEYIYNNLELLTEIWYTDDNGTRQKAYEYEYTAYGQVHKFIDNVNSRSTVYKYDNNNRLVAFREYENGEFYHDFSSDILYNTKGLVSSVYYDVNHQNGSLVDATGWSYSYFYDDSSSLVDHVRISTQTTYGNEYYYYDDYDRVYQKVNSFLLSDDYSKKFRNQIDYTYTENNNYTSGWVNTYTSTVNSGTALTYTFTHDQNGYITKIVYSTGEEIRYVYDDIGQLIREDNGVYNETYIYTYDNAGNILTKQCSPLTAAGATPEHTYITYDYAYSSSAWGDLLAEYEGYDITYDEIGNPINYFNGVEFAFSWTGRELTGAVKYGYTYSFAYNDAGIRTSKTKNGVTTNYYLDGSLILAEETSGNITVYVYDSEGLPLGMQYHGASYAEDEWDVYWYEKNIFGDIVAVYNESGTKLISYTYDAWGNFTASYYNGGRNSTAYNNPFRYRGYYYDTDLALYYLNSRYYDAKTGRFISPDNIDVICATPHALTNKNLYAYCDNNPVSKLKSLGSINFQPNTIKSIRTTPRPSVSLPANSNVNNSWDPHWENNWLDTDWPAFFDLTDEGFEVVNWGLSLYKGSLHFDSYENHSLYVAVGNAGIYAGLNYKKGIGFDAGASAIQIGYDGRIIDAKVEFFTVGITYMYKDGAFEFGYGAGWYGWSVGIDIVELCKLLFGGA